MKQLFAAAVLVAALTACGGGGGGGGSVTPPTGGGSTTPKLAAGFSANGGASSFAKSAHFRPAVLHPDTTSSPQPTLGSNVLPFATFWVPDAYVPANAFAVIGYSEVAYVTGGAVPSPAPSVTFTTVSGPTLPVIATPSPLPQPPGLPNGASIIGGQIVGAPTAVGQTMITVSAIGQSVTLTADTYPGTALSTTTSSSLNGPTGLSFTTSGAAPTSSGTPDLALSGDGVSVSTLTAPGGIIELPGKTIDELTSSDFVAANAQTSLTPTALCSTTEPDSFIMKTQGGLLVKFEAEGLYFSGNQANGVCAVTDFPAMYQVAGMSGFAF